MVEYSTKELQVEILKLLKKFHSICINNSINYSLHGGSLLGAVREKGFIPWDDDGDVALLREDFQKLEKVITHDSNKTFYLDSATDKVKKLWLKQDGRPTVWLDIFIYDYISEKPFQQKLRILRLYLFAPYTKNDITMEYYRTNQRAKGLKNFAYEWIYRLSKNIPIEKRIRKFDIFCQTKYIGNKELVHRANDQLWAMPMLLNANKMREYISVPFEDTELLIFANYKEILTQLYGKGYMTPKKAAASETEVHNITRNSQ